MKSKTIPRKVSAASPTGKKSLTRSSAKRSVKKPVAQKGSLEAWISQSVFTEARLLAWEGKVSPLSATLTWPRTSPLVKSLPQSGLAQWESYIHPLDRIRVKQHFAGIQNRHLPCYVDYRLIDKNGSIMWVRHSALEVHGGGPRPTIRGFVSDIQTEKEYQLESLRVSEREQNRIGQDLHDDLCQVLAGVSCLMRVAESRITAKIPEETETFKELNQQIIDAMHRTRALTHGLFPGRIQIADIRGALLELAAQIKTRFSVEITTAFNGRFPKHSSAQIIQVYRVAQEAISNSIRHGNATKVEVKLEALPDRMELTVRDNGSGLGKSDTSNGGLGLHIMHYRAGTLGGEFSLSSNKPNGVTACLRYPFQS